MTIGKRYLVFYFAFWTVVFGIAAPLVITRTNEPSWVLFVAAATLFLGSAFMAYMAITIWVNR